MSAAEKSELEACTPEAFVEALLADKKGRLNRTSLFRGVSFYKRRHVAVHVLQPSRL